MTTNRRPALPATRQKTKRARGLDGELAGLSRLGLIVFEAGGVALTDRGWRLARFPRRR